MDNHKEPDLEVDTTLRQCFSEDSDFYYNVKKTTLKHYVEQIWGKWNEEFQRERHKKNFNPNHTQIIQFCGIDIGILAIEENSEVLMVHNIEILPEYQSGGIGTHLMTKIIQEADEKRKNVHLQVLKSNAKAKKFYQRLGFEVEVEGETHFRMKMECEEN